MGIQKSLFNLNFIMILKLHAKEVEYKNIMFILVLAITFYIAFLDYSKYLEKVGKTGEITVSTDILNLLNNEYTEVIKAIQTLILEFMAQ